MKWLILIAGIVSNTFASLLIKLATMSPRKLPSLSSPLSFFENLPFLLGIIFYIGAFFLYTIALTKLPLNVVHPVLTSGAIALVALCSALIFHESFYWTTGVGVILVILGVSMISLRSVTV